MLPGDTLKRKEEQIYEWFLYSQIKVYLWVTDLVVSLSTSFQLRLKELQNVLREQINCPRGSAKQKRVRILAG